jgi:predicted CopG family antitoxin
MEDTNKFIRKCIFSKPDITIEELHAKWDAAKMPVRSKPVVQSLYAQRSGIKTKYGISDLKELPIKPNGEINVSDMIRLLIKKHKTATETQIRHWLSLDGIEFSRSLFAQIQSGSVKTDKPKSELEPKASPLPVAEPAPVAAPVATEKERKELMKAQDAGIADQYLKLEDELDILIERAKELSDSDLVLRLKESRRHVAVRMSNLV